MKSRSLSLSVLAVILVVLASVAAFGGTTVAVAADAQTVTPITFVVAQSVPIVSGPAAIGQSAAVVPLDQGLSRDQSTSYVDVAQTTSVAIAGLAVLVLLPVLGLAAYWFVRSRSPRHVRDHAPTVSSRVGVNFTSKTTGLVTLRTRCTGSRAHAPTLFTPRFSTA